MNKNSAIIAIFVLILLILSTSGCLDFFNINDGSTTYEPHPTKIRYNIRYGYWINCSGAGEHTIKYDCDLPEVLIGKINYSYEGFALRQYKTLATFNDVISWNISENICDNYELGIKVDIEAESFVIADLNGEDALSLQEIKDQYPNLVNQYCNEQSNGTRVFIDPNNINIKNKAVEILNSASSNNSFILAKELFTWLKQNTRYSLNSETCQPAYITFQKKTGDCDDLSFLYISLCRSIKIPARFVRGFLVENNSAIPHAWAEIFVGGDMGDDGWVPVECAGIADDTKTEVNQNFGLESANHLRLFKDDGSNESLIISLSGVSYTFDQTLNIEQPRFFAEVTNYEELGPKQLYIDDNYRAYK